MQQGHQLGINAWAGCQALALFQEVGVAREVAHQATRFGDQQRTAGLRRPGAAALDLAYVAAGFSDGFFELGLQPWDMAAGALLITEAGGLVGNFTGDANFLEQRECMAASPRIYAQLVPLLSKYSKFASADDKRAVSESVKTLSISSQGEDDAPL